MAGLRTPRIGPRQSKRLLQPDTRSARPALQLSPMASQSFHRPCRLFVMPAVLRVALRRPGVPKIVYLLPKADKPVHSKARVAAVVGISRPIRAKTIPVETKTVHSLTCCRLQQFGTITSLSQTK